MLIALSRMRRILRVTSTTSGSWWSPASPTSRSRAPSAPTHFYPPDPSSQIVCSIGGNVAENSGGAHCFKYGFTTNYVIGLQVVLSDGEVVQLGGDELDRPGYDLLGAFVGSEGTLGVATRDHAARRARSPRRCGRWWRTSTRTDQAGTAGLRHRLGGHRARAPSR